ncbi:hypothetical protein SAMN05216288_1848 [Pseudomonas punonensis]|uniref:Uncharacterized protein n=1 Tax=Phytopseudomonas punonensis TaxID=1220495 RepID=A0A1M7ACJ8_9GAMM|nr:hypothetical protein SAMN05216288_1848 [Pseudomonas punonensis]
MLKKSRQASSLYCSASHGQKSRSKKPPAHRHDHFISLRIAPLISPRRSNQRAARPETLSHSARERP